MKYSTKLSDALHILAFLSLGADQPVSSTRIAESVKTNPAYIRQLMAALKNAGLISNTRGQANAALTRAPEAITILEVYRAVEGEKPLLHWDVDTNPACGVGIYIQHSIADCYQEIQAAAEEKMSSITLEDILKGYRAKLAGLNPVE